MLCRFLVADADAGGLIGYIAVMLIRLSIRDVVIIEKLDLDFEAGICVLTGETGAGKSILLDALGLVLGARGDAGLVRSGAERAVVTASFGVTGQSKAARLVAEQGIDLDDEIIIRRIQKKSGASQALVNDQAVSVRFLKTLGAALCEIHGQHETRALVDVAVHGGLLDAYGGLEDEVKAVQALWSGLRAVRDELQAHRGKLARAAADQAFLMHACEELRALDPGDGEEEALAEKRQMMMHAEQYGSVVRDAIGAISGDGTLEGELNAALRKMEMRRAGAGGRLDEACEALERVAVEIGEARDVLAAALRSFEFDPGELERCEERLFALRAMARKYKVPVEGLAGLLTRFEADLEAIDDGDRRLAELENDERKAAVAYMEKARSLSAARVAVARRLDEAVMGELAPLHLEKARFETRIDSHEDHAGPGGIDRVEFLVSTNAGQPFASLIKVASGGELSRFMLALKVVLAASGSAPVLVFDEIDTGAGGAVADAIGKRLAQLSDGLQVLAVTHSPQVAARAHDHLLISKMSEIGGDGERAVTRVVRLHGAARREEIARMLSGAVVTKEARAQAGRLIAGTG